MLYAGLCFLEGDESNLLNLLLAETYLVTLSLKSLFTTRYSIYNTIIFSVIVQSWKH